MSYRLAQSQFWWPFCTGLPGCSQGPKQIDTAVDKKEHYLEDPMRPFRSQMADLASNTNSSLTLRQTAVVATELIAPQVPSPNSNTIRPQSGTSVGHITPSRPGMNSISVAYVRTD